RLIQELDFCPEKTFVIEHGNYVGFYPNFVNRLEARERLNLSPLDFVCLFFGNIKAYKGVGKLMEAFDSVSCHYPLAKLVVAGKVSDEDSDRTVRKFLSNKNVRYFPGFVKNDDVQVYFNAADVSVLP